MAMSRPTLGLAISSLIVPWLVLGCATTVDETGEQSLSEEGVPSLTVPPDESEILNLDGIGPSAPLTAKAVRVLMAMPKDEALQKFIGFSAGINNAHIAAFCDDAEALEKIAQEHPRWLEARSDRYTPLDVASNYDCANAARELARQGVSLNRRAVYDPPLITASTFGHANVVRVLLEAGAKVNARSSYDRGTALHQAAFFGFPDVVFELLKHGANPNARDRERTTPLIEAADEWEPECVAYLLQYGADAHAANENKVTALHRVHKRKVAELLVKHGAPLNAQNYAGNTPLHNVAVGVSLPLPPWAEEEKRAFNLDLVALAEYLIESGADPTIRNNDGETPLDLALAGTMKELISLLENAQAAWTEVSKAP